MNYILKLLPKAKADIEDAYIWYEDQQSGLGNVFLDTLVNTYNKIQSNPEMFSRIGVRFRQALLEKFPYVIIYEITVKDVIVYSVFHTRRKPLKKYKK